MSTTMRGDGNGGRQWQFFVFADSEQFLVLWHQKQRLCALWANVGKSMQCSHGEHCIVSFSWHAIAHRLQFRCHNDIKILTTLGVCWMEKSRFLMVLMFGVRKFESDTIIAKLVRGFSEPVVDL